MKKNEVQIFGGCFSLLQLHFSYHLFCLFPWKHPFWEDNNMFSTEDMQKAFQGSWCPYTFLLMCEVLDISLICKQKLVDGKKSFCAPCLKRGKEAAQYILSICSYRKKLPFFAIRNKIIQRTVIQYTHRMQNVS